MISRYLAAHIDGDFIPESRQEADEKPAPALPAGAGRELVLMACVECHDLRKAVTLPAGSAGWAGVVGQMAQLGAPLTGSEIRIVSEYLTESFGPEPPGGRQ